jgi:hypothetical protein
VYLLCERQTCRIRLPQRKPGNERDSTTQTHDVIPLCHPISQDHVQQRYLTSPTSGALDSVIMAPVAVLQQSTLPLSTQYASFTHTRPVSDGPDLSSPPRRAPKERTPPVRTTFAFDTVESAVAAMARGEFVVVMDDESRENEGDLIIPAAGCSTEQMAWMIKHTRLVRILSVFPFRTYRTS